MMSDPAELNELTDEQILKDLEDVPDQLLKDPNAWMTMSDTLRRGAEILHAEFQRASIAFHAHHGSEWARLKTIADEMLVRPELRIPDVFDRLNFRDTRNSFSSYLNEIGVPQATHQTLMGHGPKDVTGSYYTRVTSLAFQDAGRRMTSGWSAVERP